MMDAKTQTNAHAGINTFLLYQRELQKIDPEFPLQYGVCLAEIALNEGLSVTDLSKTTGMALSTVSRIVGALSKYRQRGGKPYGLIRASISKTERRRKELHLTPKGQAVIDAINTILK